MMTALYRDGRSGSSSNHLGRSHCKSRPANPYGRQGMLVPGITAKITSNVTLWFEYTYWDSHSGSPSQSSVLENGYQMIVDWHF